MTNNTNNNSGKNSNSCINNNNNNNNCNNNYKNTKNNLIVKLNTPINDNDVKNLKIGDKVAISGKIYTGRDAALPKLVSILNNIHKTNTNSHNINKANTTTTCPFDIWGSALIHTACSDAGIAPTTSNKEEIESSMEYLSKSGVKIHIGKGSLSDKTVNSLNKYNSVFIITPPVAALLTNKIKSKKVVAFEKEGIEAIFELVVENIPGIVAIAKGKSIYSILLNVCNCWYGFF